MKINIEEREEDRELVIFMQAESVEDAAKLIRMSTNMVGDNTGYIGYHRDAIHGWIKIPLKAKFDTQIMSGKKY